MKIHVDRTRRDAVAPARRLVFLLAASLQLIAGPALAQSLSLAEAERLAMGLDASAKSLEAREQSLTEQAMAAGQLPDPMLKLGVVGLPTDTFHLGQEPMTQVQVGVVQKFPRGQSRQLQSERLAEHAQVLALRGEDQRLRTLLAVREAWLEVLQQRRLAAINQEASEAFASLAEITQDYYATGRVQQQDVLRATVELNKVQERAARIAQQEDEARARLSAWIGADAFRPIDGDWPAFAGLLPAEAIKQGLASHPLMRALQQEVAAAETGVELAEQKYRPEFGLDLTYGGRGGTQPDGRDRSDLLSFMVTMDLPLFTGNRQDRAVAASVAESSAAMFARDDAYRRMTSEVERHAAGLRREQQRLDLFESALLPQAKFNAEATFDAYQAAVESLTTLMRARITEFELQLERARLQADLHKTRARLLYLQGETP
jgi:outer membrane protein TolC